MTRYEYDYEDVNDVASVEELFARINARGRKGWRVFGDGAFRNGVAMFERVLVDAPDDDSSGPIPLNEDIAGFYAGEPPVPNTDPMSH